MWNILRSRSLLFCDWIVFTHQQAGVSKKKVSGTTSSIRTFFPGQQLYFVDFFFLISLFFFFFYLSRGCMQKFKQQFEGGNTEWSMMMMNNTKWQWRFELRYNTDDPLLFPRENYHRRFFRISSIFLGEFFMRVFLIEKRAIKSLE